MKNKTDSKTEKLVFFDAKEDQARSFRQFPKQKAAYDTFSPVFEIIDHFIKLRNECKISQKELERLTAISQANISRFESGKIKNFSFSYLSRLVRPLGYQPHVSFEKIHH